MITGSTIKSPAFRENRDEYARSQSEWLEVFNSALDQVDQAGWEEWLRDPFFEGAPIFSRVNHRKRKGVVINQILPSDDKLRFRAYPDTFAPDSDDNLVEHVVITSTLTEESKRRARKLINSYLVRQLSPEQFTRLYETLTK